MHYLYLFFRYISILPTIHLSAIIPPEEAIRLRVPNYSPSATTKQQKKPIPAPKLPSAQSTAKTDNRIRAPESVTENIAKVSEPDFLSEDYLRKYYPYLDVDQLKQYYPKSRMEFIITVSLGFLSVICLTYFILVLYRCLCSRKYSKWRASWNKAARSSKGNSYYKQMKDALPIVLKGHLQVHTALILLFFFFFFSRYKTPSKLTLMFWRSVVKKK